MYKLLIISTTTKAIHSKGGIFQLKGLPTTQHSIGTQEGIATADVSDKATWQTMIVITKPEQPSTTTSTWDTKKPCYIPLYWLVHRDSYDGHFIIPIKKGCSCSSKTKKTSQTNNISGSRHFGSPDQANRFWLAWTSCWCSWHSTTQTVQHKLWLKHVTWKYAKWIDMIKNNEEKIAASNDLLFIYSCLRWRSWFCVHL